MQSVLPARGRKLQAEVNYQDLETREEQVIGREQRLGQAAQILAEGA